MKPEEALEQIDQMITEENLKGICGKRKNAAKDPEKSIYYAGIHQAGAVPIIFPFSMDETELAQLMESCDGFLFTGGHDVSPRFYHEEPMESVISCCDKRDVMETIVL